jgi:hypothetical protein
MDFNTYMFYNKLILAYRILEINNKIKFILSENVFNFLKNAIDVDTLVDLEKTLISKLGKRKAKEVWKDYDRICKLENYLDYRNSEQEVHGVGLFTGH